MLKLLAAAAVAVGVALLSNTALAGGTCEPLIVIAQELVTAGVTGDDVVTTDDMDVVRAYHAALGVEIPKDAKPIGAIFVRVKDKVLVGLIENKAAPCIHYKMVVPLERHKYAMMMLAGV